MPCPVQCSRVKKKCDGGRPCSRCARLNLECCDKIDHRFAAHKRERSLDTSDEAAAKRAALANLAGSSVPSSALRGSTFMQANPAPLRMTTGTFGSAAATPTATYSSSLPSPSAAAAVAMQQAQAAARQQTAAAVQQQAALLTLGLGLPTLLNLNRAALAEVGTSPQAVLAALSNPNNAIGQMLASTSGMTSNETFKGALAADTPQSDVSDACSPAGGVFAAANAEAAAIHAHSAVQTGSAASSASQIEHARLHKLLEEKQHGNSSRQRTVVRDGAPCLLRDITGSLELPAGLQGEDAMVHHSATLVLAMCPMPTCRFVMDGTWGVPLSIHANRGIAGMYNWCLHDMLTPVSKMPGIMPMHDADSMHARMQAAAQARRQGLTSYSVRALYVRPKADSKGGWYDPHAADFERFTATEVIDVQRARNGSVVFNMHVMDIRPMEGDDKVTDAMKLRALKLGKQLAQCLDDYIAEIGHRLRSPCVPGANGPTGAHTGPRSSDAERKEEYGSALEAWMAVQDTSPELAAARAAASPYRSPPAIFEARTSLHAGRVKSIISSNHMSLGCVAYLAYIGCMVWSGHPRMEQLFSSIKAQEGAEPETSPEHDMRSVVPPATRTGAPATFDATKPQLRTSGAAAAAPTAQPPTPAPASSAPSLDRLSAAAGVALQQEHEADRARAASSRADSAGNPSTAPSSSQGGGWAGNSLPDNDSLQPRDEPSHDSGSAGVPLVGGAAGVSRDTASVGGFSMDRWDGASTADGVGVFDQLMHPMAAGGMRMAPGAAPFASPGQGGGEQAAVINLIGGDSLADVMADMK